MVWGRVRGQGRIKGMGRKGSPLQNLVIFPDAWASDTSTGTGISCFKSNFLNQRVIEIVYRVWVRSFLHKQLKDSCITKKLTLAWALTHESHSPFWAAQVVGESPPLIAVHYFYNLGRDFVNLDNFRNFLRFVSCLSPDIHNPSSLEQMFQSGGKMLHNSRMGSFFFY